MSELDRAIERTDQARQRARQVDANIADANRLLARARTLPRWAWKQRGIVIAQSKALLEANRILLAQNQEVIEANRQLLPRVLRMT